MGDLSKPTFAEVELLPLFSRQGFVGLLIPFDGISNRRQESVLTEDLPANPMQ